MGALALPVAAKIETLAPVIAPEPEVTAWLVRSVSPVRYAFTQKAIFEGDLFRFDGSYGGTGAWRRL